MNVFKKCFFRSLRVIGIADRDKIKKQFQVRSSSTPAAQSAFISEAKKKPLLSKCQKKGFSPNLSLAAKSSFFCCIPDGKSEHPVKMLQAFIPPAVVGCGDHFGICL